MSTEQKYRSCLGTAADIDRNEHDYLIISSDGAKARTTIFSSSVRGMLEMYQGALGAIGNQLADKAREKADSGTATKEMQEFAGLIRQLHIPADQRDVCLGLMAILDYFFREGDAVFKSSLIALLLARLEVEALKHQGTNHA